MYGLVSDLLQCVVLSLRLLIRCPCFYAWLNSEVQTNMHGEFQASEASAIYFESLCRRYIVTRLSSYMK